MEELTVGTRIKHNRFGEGIVSKVNLTNYEIFFETKGKVEISKLNESFEIIDFVDDEDDSPKINFKELIECISLVLDKNGALNKLIDMADKWKGGKLILQPGNTELQNKEVPIDTFFHKIVMVRDRLRVLEQNINSHSKLDDQDKVNLQQYITRAYGSLTTFNVLFNEKNDFFRGARK